MVFPERLALPGEEKVCFETDRQAPGAECNDHVAPPLPWRHDTAPRFRLLDRFLHHLEHGRHVRAARGRSAFTRRGQVRAAELPHGFWFAFPRIQRHILCGARDQAVCEFPPLLLEGLQLDRDVDRDPHPLRRIRPLDGQEQRPPEHLFHVHGAYHPCGPCSACDQDLAPLHVAPGADQHHRPELPVPLLVHAHLVLVHANVCLVHVPDALGLHRRRERSGQWHEAVGLPLLRLALQGALDRI
mmetsp:Transcript_61563/g.190706  ORF Transcript_61563/g.190706 Transcript_61563/m.190706 type:complete len:243 (-) Transcript_61563:685-1413(-)